MRVPTKSISLGNKRASRMRRSSGNNHSNKNSTKEKSLAAPKRDQKPKMPTHHTDKEATTKKKPVAANRNLRKRNRDNTSITKKITAYPEDISMMTDESGKTY